MNPMQPILDAIASGVPLGKLKAGETCPTLPAVPMMVFIDDAEGHGPAIFDAAKLLNEVDSVVIAIPVAINAGAEAVAARARASDRALLVTTTIAAVAQWLALVSERRKLAHNFALFGAGDLPADAALMLKDIGAMATAKVN